MLNKNKLVAIITFVTIVGTIFLLYSGIFEFKAPDIKTYSGWMPILIATAALVDSVNPCAFSVLFLTIAFLFGMNKTRQSILKAGFLYIFGIFLTYVLIGLGLLKVLSFFNVPNLMSKVGASAIILFGIIGLINEFFPKFPIKLKIPNLAYGKIAIFIEKATLPAAFGLGFLVGLFEFPCTGGPYLFVLGLLHDQNNFFTGLIYLLFYNLIFVSPLLIILLISTNKKVLNGVDAIRRAETKQARIWIALTMILLGALIFMIQ
ncbi:MAG: cytochrome c biogenesis protein CcdA [Candidatus Pacebacteria bacterium]|nr:cytochrome c biogenesis protein CcdA [Candidatus Paceibacterota bacterium]